MRVTLPSIMVIIATVVLLLVPVAIHRPSAVASQRPILIGSSDSEQVPNKLDLIQAQRAVVVYPRSPG